MRDRGDAGHARRDTPRVEYALTGRGRSLHEVLAELVAWTEANLDEIRLDREKYDAAARSHAEG
ncbi:winged helix-turn-helix transcriptional regulator [Streptomyces nodosus]